MSPPTTREGRFVVMLKQLVERQDLGALAALRRGLGRTAGEVPEMFPYVMPFLPEDLYQRDEDNFFLVAALFAWHQLDWTPQPGSNGDASGTNFGASFHLLAQTTESGSIEKRFVALLNAHRDDLPEHLRHAVGLLKSKNVPVDWARLLRDLRAWDAPARYVQRSWARAFWR